MFNDAFFSGRGVPPLGGVCTPEDALRPGLSVDECVRRLKRFHYAFKRLHHLLTARITAEPLYELKLGWSYQAYLCAEQVAALRKRVAEMREPPLHLDVVPDTNLELFFDEILAAPETPALVCGIYAQALPALQAALERYLAETNLLVDSPSARVLRFALIELEEMGEFGRETLAALVNEETLAKLDAWQQLLNYALASAGGLDGADTPADVPLVRQFSAQPFVYDRVPRRDERFPDPYNMGVNTEALLYTEEFSPQAKVLALFVKRLRELDVPEMMASILVETPDKPWNYYLDMSRQLWDEARHGLMGQAGLASLDVDWRAVMIPFVWSLVLNEQLTPLERHGALYFIEQKLMARTGKRYEWQVALASGDPLARLFQDFDWADEVLHARIGREWYVSQFRDFIQALKFGDEASLKAKFDFEGWVAQGLTSNRNWWPALYRAACAHWHIEPDPAVLGYAHSYAEGEYSGPRFLENG